MEKTRYCENGHVPIARFLLNRFGFGTWGAWLIAICFFTAEAGEIRAGFQAGVDVTGFTSTDLLRYEPEAGAGFTGGMHLEHIIKDAFSLMYRLSYTHVRSRMIDGEGIAVGGVEDGVITAGDDTLYNDQLYALNVADIEVLPSFHLPLPRIPLSMVTYVGGGIRYRYNIRRESGNYGQTAENTTRGGFDKWDVLITGGLRLTYRIGPKAVVFVDNAVRAGFLPLDRSPRTNQILFPESRMIAYQGQIGVNIPLWKNKVEEDKGQEQHTGPVNRRWIRRK